MESLESAAELYPSDKCIKWGHNYIPGYADLFKNVKHTARNILEIGIGGGQHEINMSRMEPRYKAGNSIRMWRQYFTNADNVYAFDIDPTSMIRGEDKITTFVVDQSSPNQLINVMSIIDKQIDVIIDDGSHQINHQVISFKTLEKYLPSGGIYAIEDIQPPHFDGLRNLTIFDNTYREYIRSNYNIVSYDTRAQTGRNDDVIVAFIKK
jgi:hypothetical protein